jgi:hypothetical protein
MSADALDVESTLRVLIGFDVRLCRTLEDLIETYQTTTGDVRRSAGMRIRDMVNAYPDLLMDRVPDDVYRSLYRVRAQGTVTP